MEKVKVKLSDPIQAHGETVGEIEIKKPLAREVIKHGFPTTPALAAKFISDLAGIPPSSVESMSIKDFSACVEVIGSFFGDAQPTSST